jgi:hypothetical protein
MGWNSYDAYGTTVSEAQFRANARWMSEHLARYGWRYAVIDAEWFVRNPTPSGGAAGSLFVLDRYGRYIPAPNRFPSAAKGAGFRPLADYVHSLGLRFGIHILRGIPREAVARNLPIAGSRYTAAQAAALQSTCPWNPDTYGVDSRSAAGQAYYDSIARLYAAWGVDLIKADCIASHPYAQNEIRMLSAAMQASGRHMVLSLSPGPAPIGKIAELRRYSTMWRISNDVWDLWHSTVAYPQGVDDQFAPAARWAPLTQPGRWPDADMLALGYLGPAPGWGKARETRLTRAEQRTYLTLWCIARSPLFMGGNLTRADHWSHCGRPGRLRCSSGSRSRRLHRLAIEADQRRRLVPCRLQHATARADTRIELAGPCAAVGAVRPARSVAASRFGLGRQAHRPPRCPWGSALPGAAALD